MNRSIFTLAAAGTATLALAACSQPDETTTAPTETAATTDMATTDAAMTPPAADSHTAQFLTDAMKGDNSEVRVGKLAAEKGSTEGVRDYGNMLASDHGDHFTKLTDLANSMSVPIAEGTKKEADELYAKLQGLSGAAFDKAFVEGMVKDHQKDIDAYQQEADSSDPAPVTTLAKNTVPTLKKHLETAQSLQSKM